MDVSETQSVLAAAREYCMLEVLSRTGMMSHRGIMRVLNLNTNDYLGLSSVLDSEGCIRSDDNFVSISGRGRAFTDAIPLNTVSVLPDWSEYGDYRSGIILRSPSDVSISEIHDAATSMGADSTELFRMENEYVIRESINGTDTMDLENSRKLRFITGLKHEDVLVSVHSSSRGTANTVSAALGLTELFKNTTT